MNFIWNTTSTWDRCYIVMIYMKRGCERERLKSKVVSPVLKRAFVFSALYKNFRYKFWTKATAIRLIKSSLLIVRINRHTHTCAICVHCTHEIFGPFVNIICAFLFISFHFYTQHRNTQSRSVSIAWQEMAWINNPHS